MAHSTHNEWKDAHASAVQLARLLGRETGIEKGRQFGKDIYLVHSLPKPHNRCGFELRCEVVAPSDPF